MMDPKEYKYNNEELVFVAPDINDLPCKTCNKALQEKGVIPGYLKASCEQYEDKPSEILFEHAECKYYVS